MTHETTESELRRVRDWAEGQLAAGAEPPWSSFLLDRLVETIDALLAGKALVETSDMAQPSASHPGLRLVVSRSSP